MICASEMISMGLSSDGTYGGNVRETIRSQKLRQLVSQGTLVVPYTMNAFQAKIAQHVGFQAVYMSGYGVAAERGYPDVGLITQTEMVQNAKYIVDAVDLPVLCDADTGYGGPINVWRTTREYEDVGAAAIHIEDQAFPKKCGFFESKKLIPLKDHVQKIRAAVDARRDENFIVIARSDALTVNGWNDTIARSKAYYYDGGADIIFVDGIRTKEDLKIYAKELRDLPRLFNCELRFSCSLEDVIAMGFKMMVISATVLTMFKAIKDVFQEIKKKGMVSSQLTSVREEMNLMLGVPKIYEMEKKYGSIS